MSNFSYNDLTTLNDLLLCYLLLCYYYMFLLLLGYYIMANQTHPLQSEFSLTTLNLLQK